MDQQRVDEVLEVKVKHGGEVHKVCLYAGLSALELSKLLTTVFSLSTGPLAATKAVVGFQDDEGTVLPISLACAAPRLLSQDVAYKLLLTNSESFFSASTINPCVFVMPSFASVNDQAASKTADWTLDSRPQTAPEPQQSERAAEAFSQKEEGEEVAEEGNDDAKEEGDEGEMSSPVASLNRETVQKLMRFVELLALQKVLSEGEQDVIQQGLSRGSRVWVAAYQVAQRHKSVELLSSLWKGVANNALSDRGLKLVILGQENLLEILDLLLQARRLTRTQHVNLQHLVLLQHEAVAHAYETFRSSDDIELLTSSLVRLADEAEALIRAVIGKYTTEEEEKHKGIGRGGDDEEGEEEQEEEEGLGEDERDSKGSKVNVLSFEEVVAEMDVNGEERQHLGEWLSAQYDQGNDILVRAYQQYQADGNKRKLLALLFHVLKIEVNKRATEAAAAASALTARKETANRWEGKVPADLLVAVLRLVKASALSVEDAEDVLDLSIPTSTTTDQQGAGGEEEEEEEKTKDARQLVRAAWDVYQLEKDPADFIDTIARVLRVWREKNARKAPLMLCAAGAEAELIPVRRAILAQCLDIMIGQRSLDLPGFRALVRLLDSGSDIMQAAIDAFLVDEDVEELLDTLRLIAMHASSVARGEGSEEGTVSEEGSKAAAGGVAGGGTATGMTETEGDCESLGEDMSFASDRAVKCSAASVASYSSMLTLEDERGESEAAADMEREEILQALVGVGGISQQEGSFLIDLMYSSRERPLVNAILADYIATKDAALLSARLRELVNLLLATRTGRSIGELGGQEEEEEDDDEDEEDDDDGDEGEEEEEQGVEGQEEEEEEEEEEVGERLEDREEGGVGRGLETLADVDRLFLEIVQDMNPTNLETAALRLCLARRDPNLTTALEYYRVSQDADDLKDTLRRVARQTILSISREQEDGKGEGDVEADEEEDAEVERESRETDQPEKEACLDGKKDGRNHNHHISSRGVQQEKESTTSAATATRTAAEAGITTRPDDRENVGKCHKDVLSELVGESYISSEERERVLSCTSEEAKGLLASAIQAYDLKHETAQGLAATLRELLVDQGAM